VTVDGHARYFTRRADASFDPSEVERETTDLAAFIDAARAEHHLTDDQLFAIGYSNGANMIASLLAKYPGLVKKAVLFRGMLPVTFSEHPDLTGVDILLLNGEADHIMDKDRVAQLQDHLADCGANVSLHWTNAGHQLASEDIAIASQWLAL
jgi:predicted esterase